jgi:hypothetical protein
LASPSDHNQKVWQRIGERIHDDAHPMPQPPNPGLDPAESAALDTWINAGAPAFAACQPSDGGAPATVPTLSCVPDTFVKPSVPTQIPSGMESYVCYGFEAPVTAKRHVVGFAPAIDNANVLHHVSLLQADTPVSSTPTPCDLGGNSGWRVVFGWAPGASAFELPQAAGFPEDSNTHWVVQLHYLNATAKDASDASGFQLCTTAQLRANDADVMAFGTEQFTIPASSNRDITCSVQVPWWGATTHLFAAFPHMHRLGQAISTVALPGGSGAPASLGAQPHWDFGVQSWIAIDDLLQPGDVVKTRCAWSNPTGQAVTFGTRTSDEMCYSFTMYYPRIENALWGWNYPAAYSTCASSL